MTLTPIDEPCDECGEEGDVLVLNSHMPGSLGVALCAQCRIRAEAMLRGSRKSGPRAGQWEKVQRDGRTFLETDTPVGR